MTSDVMQPPTSALHRAPVVLAPRQRRVRVRAPRTPRPGWPLTALLLGYPLWWILGLAQVAPLVAGVVMAWQLRRFRRPLVVRGFGIWLLFLAWVLIGVFVLQLDAPGAIPGGSANRYFTFAFRLAWYLTATVTALYVYNLRPALSSNRIARDFGWLFVTVTAGGVLGTVWPTLNFPSAVELLLPHHLRQVQFVYDTVHPVVAQLYTVDGVLNPRTSAPFAYTNIWGLNIACLLPLFCVSWLRRDAGWRRRVAPIVLLAATYAIVESQNRGLWLALAAMVVVASIRALLLHRYRQLAVIAASGLVGLVLLVATPLGQPILARLHTASSNAGRANLGELTLSSVLHGSPIIGFGTTRNVVGSFYSIAGGDSATCKLCSPPALGTQGQLWLVVFGAGFGGLLLYCWFLIANLVRGMRLRSGFAAAGALVITAHLATMVVYDSISMAELTVFAGVGLIWRAQEDAARNPTALAGVRVPLRSYWGFVRTNAVLITACALLGAGGGLALQHVRGVNATATATVLAPPAPSGVGSKRSQTLDTIAGLAQAPGVRAAVARVLGHPVGLGDPVLSITATAQTRLLQVHVNDPRPKVARRAAVAAATALVAERRNLLAGEQQATIEVLRAQRRSLLAAVPAWPVPQARGPAAASMTKRRAALTGQAEELGGKMSYLARNIPVAGTIEKVSPAYTDPVAWLAALFSGLMIGLAAGLGIARARQRTGRRVGRAAELVEGLPVLLRIAPQPADRAATPDAYRVPGSLTGATVLPASDDPTLRHTARRLQSAAGPPHGTAEVALVVNSRTRMRDVQQLRSGVEQCAGAVRGVVLIEEERDGRASRTEQSSQSMGSRGRSN